MTQVIEPITLNKDNFKGIECHHVTYCESQNKDSDIHLVKSYVHLKDGTRFPKMIIRKNYERTVWVTKEGYRNHKDKKEYEVESKLQSFPTTQLKMCETISRALYGRPFSNTNYKRLASSPYLYGTDIESTCLVKKEYSDKYPDCVTGNSRVAVLDIETDVIRGSSEIILITLSFKDRVITAINSSFIPRSSDPIGNSMAVINKDLGDLIKKRNIKVDLVICDTAAECCQAVIAKAHEWKPDFITVWNIDFDLPVIINTLTKANISLEDTFCDPIVPKEYRYFNYKRGPKKKVTQSGKEYPLHWADRWHTVECPASFYFIDAACLYKRIRIAKGMEPSYALDDILHKHIGIGKLDSLNLEEDGLLWHMRMQKEFPFHYVAYNIFDCIGVELLDEKNGDICRSFPILCGDSDFKNFNKNPRRIVDDMHFFYREFKSVIATTGSDIADDENDEHVIGLDKWIATLPAFMLGDIGIRVIKQLPTVRSLITIHNAD